MTQLSQFMEAVTSQLQQRFSNDVIECRPLPGLLETTDISAIHGRTPAIYLSIVGTGDSSFIETGEQDVVTRIVAYLLAVNSEDSIKREQVTYQIVSDMLGYVPGQRWGLAYAHPAVAVESADLHGLAKGFKPDVSSWRVGVSVLSYASDLYGGDDPISNMALWAVTWEQTLRLGEQEPQEEWKIPTELHSRIGGDDDQLMPE